MIFILICKDKPGHLDLRLSTRPAHLEYLNGLLAEGAIKFAGPFLDEEGKPKGSLLAIEAGDRAAAQAIADADPYVQVGLFQSVEIQPWNWTINNPEAA